MAHSRPGMAYDGDAVTYERTGLLPAGGPSRSGFVPAGIDADTQDYYDDFDRMPPPHRLSTAHSPSPYPEGIASSPPPSVINQRASPYHDPFHNQARPSTESAGFLDAEYPARRSFGDMDHHYTYGHGGAGPAMGAAMAGGGRSSPYGAGAYPPSGRYMATPAHDDDLDGDDYYRDHANARPHHEDYDDAWGNSQARYSASRDRYLARKEAQGAAGLAGAAGARAGAMGASGSRFSLPWGNKEKGYGYNDYGEDGHGNRKSRLWWYIGGVGGLALLIVIIAISVTVAKSKGGNGGSSDSSGNGVTGVTKSDPKDPSKFDLDSRLKQSFYGIAYTPLNAMYPACGDSLDAVIEDVQLLSQLTTRIRLYGTDCNVTQLVLEAINQTKVNMTIYPAVWVDNNATTYARQVEILQDAITRYGVDRIEGVTVGNEYLLNGGSEADLITKMADMRTLLAGMNLPKTVPVGTGDAGSMITATLAAASDYIQANIHPFFGGVPVELAAGWTWDYTMTNTPSVVLTAPNNPRLIIAEVGWPSGANETAFANEGPAVAGMDGLNTLLATYVCAANANASAASTSANPGYFWFEAFDEPWKNVAFGGVEAHWGLFDSSKKLKEGIVLPDCAHP